MGLAREHCGGSMDGIRTAILHEYVEANVVEAMMQLSCPAWEWDRNMAEVRRPRLLAYCSDHDADEIEEDDRSRGNRSDMR